MQFRVEGVDATTGRDVDPFIVEAENEAVATSEGRRRGVRPTNVEVYQPSSPTPAAPTGSMGSVRSATPVMLGMLGLIFWALAFVAITTAVNNDSLAAMVAFGTCTISGLICIVGGMIIGALNRDHHRRQ